MQYADTPDSAWLANTYKARSRRPDSPVQPPGASHPDTQSQSAPPAGGGQSATPGGGGPQEYHAGPSHDSPHQTELAGHQGALIHSTPWTQLVQGHSDYLASLTPECSSDSFEYGRGYRAIGGDPGKLHGILAQLLIEPASRDRFEAFMASMSKPDGWYCMLQICSSGHETAGPLDGACLSHIGSQCQLHVKHLAGHANGRALDFRVPSVEAGVDGVTLKHEPMEED